MSLTPRLDLRQSQTLTMTPRLQQAIRLLQMSALELDNAVEQELEKNPFLEREGEPRSDDVRENQDFDEFENRQENQTLIDSAGQEEASLDTNDIPTEDSFYEQAVDDETDAGFENDFSADPWSGTGAAGQNNSEIRAVDLCAAPKQTLQDALISQINISLPDEEDRRLAFTLMERLDENGYLIGELKDICSAEQLERVLTVLQGFYPTGVFARDLSECLALQLKELNRYDPAMAVMLKNLDLIAGREYKKLSKLCGVNEEDISDMIAEIRRLNPRPASVFEASATNILIPDVLLRQDKSGHYIVELNQAVLPRVLINHAYVSEIASTAGKDKAAKKFLTQHLSSANWLIKALDQRAQTILKVAEEIVIRQKDFFRYGEKALKPMVLKDVAEAVGMHESSISRVTANKYIACSRGIFELKYFFSQALEGRGKDESVSSVAVRRRIKELIDSEKKENILSDEALVYLLKRENIEIARRTVAKYREAMGIPTSAQRKRDKRLKS